MSLVCRLHMSSIMMSNGLSKIKLAILALLCCGEFVNYAEPFRYKSLMYRLTGSSNCSGFVSWQPLSGESP